MKLIAMLDVDDLLGRGTEAVLEAVADDLTNLQSRVHGLVAFNVQVGEVMDTPTLIENIKRELEDKHD